MSFCQLNSDSWQSFCDSVYLNENGQMFHLKPHVFLILFYKSYETKKPSLKLKDTELPAKMARTICQFLLIQQERNLICDKTYK